MTPPVRSRLDAFDKAVDAAFEPYRGNRRLNVAARVVSNLADYGFVWSLLAAAKGRQRGPARRRAAQALAVAGISSVVLNTAVKQLVGRQRPEGSLRVTGDDTLWVRPPSSSSFPSGHTLAAFTTAVMLAESPGELLIYTGFAATVAASRVYLQAHHASDVVGGAVLGTGLGVAGRRFLPDPR